MYHGICAEVAWFVAYENSYKVTRNFILTHVEDPQQFFSASGDDLVGRMLDTIVCLDYKSDVHEW
jgi:hypothetical protein